MSIQFSCPGCGASYTVPDQVAGQSTTCRECKRGLVVPGPFVIRVDAPVAPFAPPRHPLRWLVFLQTLCLLFIAGVVLLWLIGEMERERRVQEALKSLQKIR